MGRPLIPPLSFTHWKYACDMPVMPVKSVPGCLVTIAPSVSGAPVAFWPLPRPHLPVLTSAAPGAAPAAGAAGASVGAGAVGAAAGGAVGLGAGADVGGAAVGCAAGAG